MKIMLRDLWIQPKLSGWVYDSTGYYLHLRKSHHRISRYVGSHWTQTRSVLLGSKWLLSVGLGSQWCASQGMSRWSPVTGCWAFRYSSLRPGGKSEFSLPLTYRGALERMRPPLSKGELSHFNISSSLTLPSKLRKGVLLHSVTMCCDY